MLLHSEAKVEFYKKYLEIYLRVLYLARKIREINIFDVFCGTGLYDNDKKGSPLVAFDAIRKLREEHHGSKKITLNVNDSKASKISKVQEYIEQSNEGHCEVNYRNENADDFFREIIDLLESQDDNVRNLIFIDPYGYKEIRKEILLSLLTNGRSELIIFLPISQMQRFTTVALGSDLKPYEPLKKFVDSFFDENHRLRKHTVSSVEYISDVRVALRFNKYFTTSFSIQRDKSNTYALFFISPHIYGFEKILEVKWQLDEAEGGGFKQPEPPSLFPDQEKQLIKQQNYLDLEGLLEDHLSSPKDNLETYEFVLANEFLPRHANEIFRHWANEKPNFNVLNCSDGKPARKGSFYINWKYYRNFAPPRVIFKLGSI